MFIKIDHISFTSKNFERDIEYWKKLGFGVKFVKRRAPNGEIKLSLLARFSKYHDLALLVKKDCPSVELVRYSYVRERASFIEAKAAACTRMITCKTHDIKKSLEFLKTLGFKILSEEGKSAALRFDPLTNSNSFGIVLEKKYKYPQRYYLDSKGFNALALISSSVRADHDFLKSKGYVVTPIECVHVRERPLYIFFVTGPSGEMIEVIGVNKL